MDIITSRTSPERSRRERLKTDRILKYRELIKFTNLKLNTK
jgi:hypothetical protein